VGIRGGAEAEVHTARLFLGVETPYQALLKLDFMSAFNTVRRDSFIKPKNSFDSQKTFRIAGVRFGIK